MSFNAPGQSPQVPQWDPQQGDLAAQHGIYENKLPKFQVTPQQLHAAGWMDCPVCHQFWLSPENKAQIEAHSGYFTCPKCKRTSNLLYNLPWHGAEEEDYYPKGKTGGGTAVGIPMSDIGQIAENVVRHMGNIPGYGPIVWWHGSATDQSPLDGATQEWGIEVKGQAYDASYHAWHPGDQIEAQKKNAQAQEMGLKGVLGVYVLLNFRSDTADVYAKAMPLETWFAQPGRPKQGVVQWFKRTGEKVASDLPFTNPLKDPHNPSPGPYSMAAYYERPMPLDYKPPEPAPF